MDARQSITDRFIFNMFAALAEFDREIIRERPKAGFDATRARGKNVERPKGLFSENLKVALTALDLHDTGRYAISEIAKRMKLPIATCNRYIRYVKDDKR
jgi:DNA invertase Pin-like site-specific DNA recombinase